MYHDAARFTDYWRSFRLRTMRVLAALPEGDLEWSPAPGKFSFGDLYRHLAGAERYMFGENALRRPSCYPGHAQALAAGLEGVRAYVERCHGEALEIFAGLTEDDLESRCVPPGGRPMTVWKWLRSMVEHEAHHRGQLYLMASLRGLRIEPIFGLTEEQVLERSQPKVPGGGELEE